MPHPQPAGTLAIIKIKLMLEEQIYYATKGLYFYYRKPGHGAASYPEKP